MRKIFKTACLGSLIFALNPFSAFGLDLYTSNCTKLLELNNLNYWKDGSKKQFFYVKGSARNITGRENKFMIKSFFYTNKDELVFTQRTPVGKGSFLGDRLSPKESGMFEYTLSSKDVVGADKLIFQCDFF